ncbi:MAG TPA: HAD-IB family phosphatase [Candidatus Limnocylindrales bacterium]|nr:HAD-IB family phosphatase [Candidatus Limnocylindrales bacterium]
MTHPIVVSDMDGTLAQAETWRGILTWLRANHPSKAADRFVAVRLPRVAFAKATRADKEAFRARWMEDQARLLAGLPADGVDEMARWVVEDHLWPTRREDAIDLVRAAADAARSITPEARLVLASGAYQPIVDRFAARIGADVALGTPLEIHDGVATGGVLVRVQTGEQKAAAVRAIAEGGEVVAAFGDTGADAALLAMATRAVAVYPDRELRRVAAARGWELFEGR